MDWHLIYRTHEEMLDLATTIPAEDIGSLRLFTEADKLAMRRKILCRMSLIIGLNVMPFWIQRSEERRVGKECA